MLGGLVGILAGHLVETAKLKAYAIALYAAAALSLLFAFIFALVSLRHWIAVTYAAQYPDLWIALGFLVIAIPLIGVGIYVQSLKPKANPAVDVALLAGPSAIRLASRRPGVIAVGIVLIAGVALGRRFVGRSKPPAEAGS